MVSPLKLNEDYFQRLLVQEDALKAVFNLRGFWRNRLNFKSEKFGLHDAEYYVELALIYIGEVENGGHIQYFLNCGVVHLEDTLDALKAVELNSHANVLSRSGIPAS